MIGIGISAALLLAAAQEGPAPVEVGAWLVAPASSDSCAAVAEFGPNLMVSVRENAMGIGDFVLSDDRWKLAAGKAEAGSLSWDGWTTTRPAAFVARKTGSGLSVLVMTTDGGFTEELAGAKHLWLRIPGVGFDDDLDIPDAGELIGAIVDCNDKLP